MSLTKRWMDAQAVSETPAARIERARERVHFALRASEPGIPDMDTLCDVERALHAALRDLEQAQLSLAVMERQHERMVS